MTGLAVAGLAWTKALVRSLGLHDSAIKPDKLEFHWGGPGCAISTSQLSDYAQRRERDVVYLEFTDPIEKGPTNIILANYHKGHVTLSGNCELWAIPRGEEVEILTATHRFRIEDDGGLKRRPHHMDEMRFRRVQLGHERWRAIALQTASETSRGWKFISMPSSSIRPAEDSARPDRSVSQPKCGSLRHHGGENALFPLRSAESRPFGYPNAAGTGDAEARHVRLQALKPTYNAWGKALQDLMRHPKSSPTDAGVPVTGLYDKTREMLLNLSRKHRKSLVCLQFGEPASEGPIDVTVVLHSYDYDKVVESCEVFADSDSAPLQLISGCHRIVAGPNGRLSRKNALSSCQDSTLRQKAWERWRQAAMALLPPD